MEILKAFKIMGEKVILFFNYVGSLTLLTGETLVWTFVPPLKGKSILEQMKKIGLESLLIISLVALFTGIVLVFQTAYQLQKISASVYIGSIVALSIVRELGPVLTALVVAGRCGAAIAAEIGTMKVTEQIDALRAFAVNPVRYLVVPRFLALLSMLPILTIYADFIGMIGGYLIGVYRLGIGSALYIRMTFEPLVFKDIFGGLLKSVVFGLIIAIVACFEGLTAKGGAEGVGRATTLAVVSSFILIIASDCLFTALFYFAF